MIDPSARREALTREGPARRYGPRLKFEAQRRANDVAGIITGLQAEGITSARALARELNMREIPSPRGGRWWPATAVRLLER